MQMKIAITLDVYFFLRQLNKKSLNCILEKKLKSSKKIALCIESKAGFLVELKHDNLQSSFTLSIDIFPMDSPETFENPSWLEMRNGA